MDKRQVVFIVIVVIIGLLYVLGTVFGALNSNNRSTRAQPQLDPTQLADQLGGIQDAVARPPAIKPQELRANPDGSTSSDCLRLQSDLLVPVGATCLFTISPAEKSILGFSPAVRKLNLTLSEGGMAAITLQEKVRQENGSQVTVTADDELAPNNEAKALDIYQQGGTLSIRCPAVPGVSLCRIKLGQ